ncbi:MAG: serine/threonine-protein kinase [Myxococcota bacterium]
MPSRPPTFPEIDGYKIERELGRGSMGVVYAARDTKTGSEVALKVLKSDVCDNPLAYTRFQREIAAAVRINHEGIPTFHDAGELPDGRFFFAMELLQGADLEEWWEEGQRLRVEAMDHLVAALEPLASAHEQGFVHRDLKPGNLFVVQEDGQESIKLLDFGIAQDLQGEGGARTATGISVGTPAYMSPEQVSRPRSVGPATDIWAMGVIMYEALSGVLPYAAETPHGTLVAVATQTHAPLRTVEPGIHPDLAALVDRCLSRDMQKRPQNAAELRDRLKPMMAKESVRATLNDHAARPSPVSVNPPTVEVPAATTEERRPAGWLVGLFALLLLLAGVAAFAIPGSGAEATPRTEPSPTAAAPRVRVQSALQAAEPETAAETTVETTVAEATGAEATGAEATGAEAPAEELAVETPPQVTMEPTKARRARRARPQVARLETPEPQTPTAAVEPPPVAPPPPVESPRVAPPAAEPEPAVAPTPMQTTMTSTMQQRRGPGFVTF